MDRHEHESKHKTYKEEIYNEETKHNQQAYIQKNYHNSKYNVIKDQLTQMEKINEISNEKLFKDVTIEATNFKIPMDGNGDRKKYTILINHGWS